MQLVERGQEFQTLSACADDALAGRGQLVVVSGESGAGKTAFIEQFLADRAGSARVLSAMCDPLDTPRPLGPVYDIAGALTEDARRAMREAEHPYDIYDAVLADLAVAPTILVIDDLHWADQGTIDLLRFVLRRIHRRPLLVVGMARGEEVGVAHPLRMLLADVARSGNARLVGLQPLSVEGIKELAADRAIDAEWLHRITGGNAFFVTEMLDHSGGDLPTTVRDAVLGRTVGLGEAEWDVLNLLSCSPEAIPDYLLTHLGVPLAPLHRLRDAHLIGRTSRGVAFRHDLCRLAVASVLPPGAEPALHLRMMAAYDEAGRTDPAVMTHHALGAGDQRRLRHAAIEAGRASARSGAHRQAAEFYRIAMESGGDLSPDAEAELLELVAAEYYLTDQLDNAIDACRRALAIRKLTGAVAELSADHHSLAVYDWYNADRRGAEEHARHAVTVVDGDSVHPSALASLGHAFAMQAYLAMQSNDLQRAQSMLAHAREIAAAAGDPALSVRVEIIEGICSVIAGEERGRATVLELMRSAPKHLDEIYSSGYSNLTYLDVEQRRLADAAELLNITIPMTWERDLPICRVWQLGARGRLSLLSGDWDDALADAVSVLETPTAPLARTWPHAIRGLIMLRRNGDDAGELTQAWTLARRYGEPVRVLPVAAALVERAWLANTGDAGLAEYEGLLAEASGPGLEWARGELAMWLRRLDGSVDADGLATPYRLYLDGDIASAAAEFERIGSVYEAAIALTEAGGDINARRGLDMLDRIGATAVADKIRLDLRAGGMKGVPARRRTTTLSNPAGLTRRQVEVLRRLDDGLTNAELAAQLYLSAKTVDHHVSAILGKLAVANRREAVRRGRELGIIA
ncbi:AAA family ATPase [Mycobacterium sp. URHB0044]|uniref:ATP-binding protein n=1 Tax=Mycobacterium sp. URHB0044 TaxID=1380386 RepID=UPI00055A0A7D|nr:LuxR family transcriptional regulator [Mycobacterium sp. URHB0044]